LPDVCTRAIFSSISYKYVLVIKEKFCRHEKESEKVILETDSDKAITSDSDSDMMKTLVLQVETILQVGVKFILDQDHNTLGILMMSIVSLEVPVA
jgi:hypothetical protein